MTTHRWLTFVFALMILPTAFAAEPLPIPADALAVAQLKGREAAIRHVEEFVTVVKPEAKLDLAGRLKKLFADAGRDIAAVAADRPVAVMAFAFDGWNSPTPPWVWVLPVADAKAFRRSFLTDAERGDTEQRKDGIERRGPWFLVSRPGSVALTLSEDAAAAYRDSRETLTAERLGKLAPVVAEADASVFVNVAAVNAKYGDAIRAGVQFAEFVLQSGGNGLIPTFDAKQVEVVRFALGGLTQFLADGRNLAVGLKLGAEGASLRVEAALTPGSPTARRFAGDRVASLDGVSKLPAGYTAYTASAWGPAAAAVLQTLARDYRAPKDEDRAAAAIGKYDAELRQAGLRLGVSKRGVGGFLLETPDAAGLTAAHARVIRTLPKSGWAGNIPLAERPGVRDDALEAGGFTLKRATVVRDIEAGVETVRDPNLRQATLESIRRLVNEKTVLWFGDDGKRYAEVEAAEPEAARTLLGELLVEANRVGDVPEFVATRKALPREASFLALAEAAPAVALFADYTKSVSGALPAVPGFEVPDFRAVKDPPLSYLGVAVTADGGGFGLTLVVPAAAARVAVDATVIPGP